MCCTDILSQSPGIANPHQYCFCVFVSGFGLNDTSLFPSFICAYPTYVPKFGRWLTCPQSLKSCMHLVRVFNIFFFCDLKKYFTVTLIRVLVLFSLLDWLKGDPGHFHGRGLCSPLATHRPAQVTKALLNMSFKEHAYHKFLVFSFFSFYEHWNWQLYMVNLYRSSGLFWNCHDGEPNPIKECDTAFWLAFWSESFYCGSTNLR